MLRDVPSNRSARRAAALAGCLSLSLLVGLEPMLIPLSTASAATAWPTGTALVRRPLTLGRAVLPAEAPAVTDAPSEPPPPGSPALLAAGPGTSALSGRVLQTDGAPLRGVVLSFGAARAETDADGLFLLAPVKPGEAVLTIDGRRAASAGSPDEVDHGVHETRVRAEAGRTVALPWVSWLPVIDHAHDVAIASPLREAVAATTPDVPDLELRLPKGAVLTDVDGKTVTRVGLTRVPVDRPPFPLPRNVGVPVYFTAQPGGAVISSADGAWLGAQVVYPNYAHELPRARGLFWRNEPDGIGWSPYGTGTVSADGRQVVPDPDTRVYALSGAMFCASACTPPPNGPPPGGPPGPPDPAGPGGPGGPGGPPPGGDPVDLASGLFVQTQTDLAIADIMPVAVTRTYRPGDYNQRDFGVGMTLPYSMNLTSVNQYQVVDLIQADGGTVHYTRIIDPNNPSDNGWVTAHFTTTAPGPYYQSRIDWNGNGWNLTRKDGLLYVFGDHAPLQSVQDRFGNKITIVRSNGTTGTVTQVSSPSGRFVRFAYDSGNRITQAVDNIGRTVGYAYDASGRMTTVTDPDGGVTTYAWDSSNRVQSIKDARGTTFLTNTYDNNDRVTKQVLADGAAYTFAYALDGNGKVTATTVTDPKNAVHKVTYNASGYALTDNYAVGTAQEADWTYTRDATSNLPLTLADPLGRKTSWTYDANGNVLSVTKLSGTSGAVTTSYTYSPMYNRVATVTDALGRTATTQFDALERVTSVADALGHARAYTYNGAGQALTAADALGNITAYTYGADGDVVAVKDPLGRTSTVYTDAAGRRVFATDPLGGRTMWTLDAIDGPAQVADADGAAMALAYTPVGSVAGVTDARGGKVAFTYDVMNRLATRTDAVSAVAKVTSRDGLGNVLGTTDRKGQVTSITYDPLSRPTGATFADKSTLAWTWDLAGRLTKLVDSVGGTVSRTYDGLDRLLTETTAQGTVTYTYDKVGNMLTLQAGSQAQTSYSYDAANRLTGITQGSTSVGLSYDAADRRTSAALPGSVSATYTYDAASELTGITYASGSTALGTLTYGYDASGHVAARGGTLFQSILPAAVTSATYDAANRLTARTAAGTTAKPTWDANGNLTNDGTSAYTWDARDKLLTVGSKASFVNDGFGRRVSATLSGTATSFLYGGWGVLQEQQGGKSSADLIVGLGADERFARSGSTFLVDALGSTMALVTAGAVKTSYGYDPYGVSTTTGTASTSTSQFTGRENDGDGLIDYRDRYYNPAWGRFISEDPVGFSGGINLYDYVKNDPIRFRDPSGHCIEDACVLEGAALYGLLQTLGLAGSAAGAGGLVGGCLVGLGPCAPPTPPTAPTPQAGPAPPSACPINASCSAPYSPEKQALTDMAKGDKRKGITNGDMQAYKDLNKELPDPFPENKVRGPEAHNSGGPWSQVDHGHVGPVDHIPIVGP